MRIGAGHIGIPSRRRRSSPAPSPTNLESWIRYDNDPLRLVLASGKVRSVADFLLPGTRPTWGQSNATLQGVWNAQSAVVYPPYVKQYPSISLDGVDDYYNTPDVAGLRINGSTGFTGWIVARFTEARGNRVLFGKTNGYEEYQLFGSDFSPPNQGGMYVGNGVNQQVQAASSTVVNNGWCHVFKFGYDPAAKKAALKLNDEVEVFSAALSGSVLPASTVPTVGAYPSGVLAGAFEIYEHLFYSTWLPDGSAAARITEKYLQSRYMRFVIHGKRIVCLGDSLTFGNGVNTTLVADPTKWGDYPYQLQGTLGMNARVINSGVGGNTWVDMLARVSTDVNAYLQDGDIVAIHGGRNDLTTETVVGSGVRKWTDAQILANAQSVISAIRASGKSVKIVFLPLYSGANSIAGRVYEDDRASLQALYDANIPALVDVYIPASALPLLTARNADSNNTGTIMSLTIPFFSDGTHLTYYGYNLVQKAVFQYIYPYV